MAVVHCSERWAAMTARARDAWIAEHVMGLDWCRHKNVDASKCLDCNLSNTFFGRIAPPDYYTTDPAADYEVLKRVRETWEGHRKERFWEALGNILCERGVGFKPFDLPSICFIEHYRPGDYSKACYGVLNGTV